MTDQTDKARRRLPYIIDEMDIQEIAHYCDATGLSQDPAINALVGKLCEYETEEMKRLSLDNSKRFLDWADDAKAQLGQKAPPGRKSEYLPLILKMLKFGGPLKRSELVLKVLRVRPDAGKGAIYRAIAKATQDRQLINLRNVLHHPK